MLRLFLLLLVSFALGCSSTHSLPPPLTGPQQAQHDLQVAVALVTDLGPLDSIHGTFCGGTWISPYVILTANHCLEGYAHMQHRARVIDALIDAGLPPPFAVRISKLDPDEVKAHWDEVPDFIKDIFPLLLLPDINPDTLDVPYIVSSQVVAVGQPPTHLQHTHVLARYPTQDLAFLQVEGTIPPHRVATLAPQGPAIGETLTFQGNIKGNFFSFRRVTLSAYRAFLQDDEHDQTLIGPFLQLDGNTLFGDSGSGVFNDRGELVGVVLILDDNTHFGYAITSVPVRQAMLGQHLLSVSLNPSAPDPDLSGE